MQKEEMEGARTKIFTVQIPCSTHNKELQFTVITKSCTNNRERTRELKEMQIGQVKQPCKCTSFAV